MTSFESGFKSTTRKDSTRNGYRQTSTGIFPATLRPYAFVETSKLTRPSTAVVLADTTTFIASAVLPLGRGSILAVSDTPPPETETGACPEKPFRFKGTEIVLLAPG